MWSILGKIEMVNRGNMQLNRLGLSLESPMINSYGFELYSLGEQRKTSCS